MNKLLVLFFLFLIFNCYSQGNITINGTNLGPQSRVNLNLNIGPNLNKNYKSGPIIVISGLSLIAAGYFLPPEQYTTPSGYKVDKPFLNQGLRPIVMATGLALTTVGVVITIKDRKNE